MGNFRFDELMKDLGLPEERRRAPVAPAEPLETSKERPDLAGSGLGEVEQVTPEGAPPLAPREGPSRSGFLVSKNDSFRWRLGVKKGPNLVSDICTF